MSLFQRVKEKAKGYFKEDEQGKSKFYEHAHKVGSAAGDLAGRTARKVQQKYQEKYGGGEHREARIKAYNERAREYEARGREARAKQRLENTRSSGGGTFGQRDLSFLTGGKGQKQGGSNGSFDHLLGGKGKKKGGGGQFDHLLGK